MTIHKWFGRRGKWEIWIAVDQPEGKWFCAAELWGHYEAVRMHFTALWLGPLFVSLSRHY